jgi:hypothetical protein
MNTEEQSTRRQIWWMLIVAGLRSKFNAVMFVVGSGRPELGIADLLAGELYVLEGEPVG